MDIVSMSVQATTTLLMHAKDSMCQLCNRMQAKIHSQQTELLAMMMMIGQLETLWCQESFTSTIVRQIQGGNAFQPKLTFCGHEPSWACWPKIWGGP